ncbi:MAG: TIGR04282 family arsenosugar biosynthesis glycosyltransferase [Algisphaera sp.]
MPLAPQNTVPPHNNFTVVVLAKAAVPGQVKTRLTLGDNGLSPENAAAVHAAMMQATLDRVALFTQAQHGLLAMDHPAMAPQAARKAGWTVIDQGDGTLGDRIARAWAAAGNGPVAFFGVDCPDVPSHALASIQSTLQDHDAAVGPVDDGGYWTLAAARPHPELLVDIDWGTGAVYDQTQNAAARAHIQLAALPQWHDVDHPADLLALRDRLHQSRQHRHDPALDQLADEINRLIAPPFQ